MRFAGARKALAFQGTDHHALDEVALQEGIDADDRQGGDNDHGVFEHFGSDVLNAVVVHERVHLAGHDDLPQQRLHGPYRFFGDEDQRVVIGVPVIHRVEQGDSGNSGGRQRQQNAPQIGGDAGTVQHGGLVQRVRHALKEVAHDDEVIGADAYRQDQRPERIEQAQPAYLQVQGHQTAAEQHGKDHEEGQQIPSWQILSGKNESAQNGQNHADRRADESDEQRIGVGGRHQLVAENLLIRLQMQAVRPQDKDRVLHMGQGREGADDDVPEGVEHHEDHCEQDQRGKDAKRLFSGADLFQFHYQMPPSPSVSFLAILFVTRIITRPTSDLIRPVAVATEKLLEELNIIMRFHT